VLADVEECGDALHDGFEWPLSQVGHFGATGIPSTDTIDS